MNKQDLPIEQTYGYWIITAENAKEFEPKLYTDEFRSAHGDQPWQTFLSKGQWSNYFACDTGTIYRRRIPIQKGWRLAGLEEVAGRCCITYDGKQWRDTNFPQLSVRKYIEDSPTILAVIVPCTSQPKQESMQSPACTCPALDCPLHNQAKGDDVCECGHERKLHSQGIVIGHWYCRNCSCKCFTPKRKESDVMQPIKETGEVSYAGQTSPESSSEPVGANFPNEPVCSICKWTNVSLLNIGDPGNPSWICLGCVKRHIEQPPLSNGSSKHGRNDMTEEQEKRILDAIKNHDDNLLFDVKILMILITTLAISVLVAVLFK